MSEVNMIKPPAIAVRAEASVSRVLGRATPPAGKQASEIPAAVAVKSLPSGQQQRIGHFGTSGGVQITRRGEAPVTRLAPQTLQVLLSTLSSLRKVCTAQGAQAAGHNVDGTIAIVKAIAAGHDLGELEAPAPTPAPTSSPIETK